jgi:hypothetical protein
MKAVTLALICIGLMAGGFGWMALHATARVPVVEPPVPGYLVGNEAIKRWMRGNLADPNARLASASEVQAFEGKRFKRARIAGLNGFGGPIFQEYLFEMGEGGAATVWTEEEFTQWVDAGISRLVGRRNADKWIALRDRSRAFKDVALSECR